MIGLSLCCAAVGTALGMQFTVVGLIFAAFLAFVVIGGFEIAAHWGVLATAMVLVMSLVTLELGYFVGSYFGQSQSEADDAVDAALPSLVQPFWCSNRTAGDADSPHCDFVRKKSSLHEIQSDLRKTAPRNGAQFAKSILHPACPLRCSAR